MAKEDHATVYGEGDIDVDDEEDDDVDVDDDDVDDSTSSSNLATVPFPVPLPSVTTASGGQVTVALPTDLAIFTPEEKRHRYDDVTVAAVSSTVFSGAAVVEERKPPVPIDEQRRLFQRLWTDEDEIELLQGFLDYTASRGPLNSSHHHDTTAFYDQIKKNLQLDFNKNQMVEKLRRLKKKYRTVMSKIGAGKDYVFKTPHDQATFEISRKIWNEVGGTAMATPRGGPGGVTEEGGFDDEDANPNFNVHLIDHSPMPNPNLNGVDLNSSEKKTPRPRKRSRGGAVKIEEKQFGYNVVPVQLNQQQQQHYPVQNAASVGVATPTPIPIPIPIPTPNPAPAVGTESAVPKTNLVEETVKSCLSPIFKELLHNVMNLNGSPMCNSRGFGFALSPMPLGLNGDLLADEKWRKQQILELEVYSKRLELVQDQIKAQLEELRSMGS